MSRYEALEPTERRLLERCLTGEAGAWDEFARAYTHVVERAARHALHRSFRDAHPQDVENVVQNVFVALYEDRSQRLRSFAGKCSLQAWLRSVTIHHALNYVRAERLRRGGSLDGERLAVPEAHAEDNAVEAHAEDLRRLEHHMNELPARDRLALKLHYFDGVPQRQIARILGVSENTIWPMISRARQTLEKRMRPT